MYSCDCCGREVVHKKRPGIGYWCDPCLADESWREYPWRLTDEWYADYLEVHAAHAAVCAAGRERGPMPQ